MKKIITIKKAQEIFDGFKKNNKKIVVSGGCFDILHIGHIRFFEKARKRGDILCLLLENDENVRKYKGIGRPINSQKDRAEILSAISFVDYIIPLSNMKNNKDYDKILIKLKPDILATTQNDPQGVHNKRQAKLINAKVSFVIPRISNKSTSNLAKRISQNF